MLVSRILVALVLLPIGLALITIGGIPYVLLIALIIGIAAWEYGRLFHAGGLQPAGVLLIGGALLIVAGRAFDGFGSAHWILSLLVLAVMTFHLIAYERGREQAATDFSVTFRNPVHRLVGAYFISLRLIPEGLWWALTVLFSVWLADTGAYLIGRRFGRRLVRWSKDSAAIGGLLATLVTPLLVLLLGIWAGPGSGVTPIRGALIGFVVAALAPLGDLGESMIKRQVGMKDSSHILLSHGGVFDRIDSWLWAAVIGYYMITLFFL
jgi:phosphatidate cytidylyltransferase